MSCKPRQISKFLSLGAVSLGGAFSFSAINLIRGDETFYGKFLMPLVSRFLDPELAHEACLYMTRCKLIRCQESVKEDRAQLLKTTVLGLNFKNPIGISAGFDKNAEALPGIHLYGVGFTEVGTVTPRPQDGNPKKRIFRIPQEKALINRCGFNNKGIDNVVERISQVESNPDMIVGVNLGKNKDTGNLSSDYLLGLDKIKDLENIDYIVINISSPNTPGLRIVQDKSYLGEFVQDILNKLNQDKIDKPLLLKFAPDLTESQIKDISKILLNKTSGKRKVDGIIITNTTISRPEPSDANEAYRDLYSESGGLSGQPLRALSTKIIGKFYQHTNGKIPIIGVGGVSCGQDAYDKIRAGASLIQLYTSLTYEGPPVINKVKRELVELLERDNIKSISDAVGLDHQA